MFVGQIIREIIYGELKYFLEEKGNNINPKPFYKTKYKEIDTLDYSIYFKTDDKTIHIFWDNTFASYGLLSKEIELTPTTNDYEQKWEVSSNEKWKEFIGQKIVDFKIVWFGRKNKYPQTFELLIKNGMSIFISASELKEGEDEYYSQMDNLLVTTDYEFLKRLENIEKKQIQRYNSKKTLWMKIFGQ